MAPDSPKQGPEAIPVLTWNPAWRFIEPPGYVPDFSEQSDETIDVNRLPWVLAELLSRHPHGDHLRRIAEKHPGLDISPSPEAPLFLVRLAFTGEPIGVFDRRFLVASLPAK